MLPLGGKPILASNIELCARHGVKSLFVNLHYQSESIRGYFGDGSNWGVSIVYKFEPKLLGTSGSVKSFSAELRGDEPFFVIYGDNISGYDLSSLMARHRESSADMCIAVFEMQDASQSGMVMMDRNDRIIGFIEKPAAGTRGPTWVNSGVYVMNPKLLSSISDGFADFGRQTIPEWIASGRHLQALRMDRAVKAFDTPELYARQSASHG